jgi:ribosomal protein L40E
VDPYRDEPTQPQFICVVCYKSLSVHAGECPKCGVERLSLGDPEVRMEVRAEAEKRLQNRHYGEWFWCYLVAFLMAIPVRFFIHDIFEAFLVALGATFVLGAANVKIWERLNARSMLRLYADRRRRLPGAMAGAEGAGAAGQKLLPAAREDDPEDAELGRVLELLGARVEGAGDGKGK